MTFTNVHTPPSDCRTVLCLMANGERVRGFYIGIVWMWFRFGDMRAEPINPVGWCELDEQDSQQPAQ